MLEAGSRGLAEGCLQLLDQRPGIEGIQEVDVAGSAPKDLERNVALLDIGRSGLLVGVGAVTEREVLQAVTSILLAEEVGDRGVVVGSVLESLERIELSAGLLNFAGLELFQELGIVIGVAQDGNASVVLGSSPDESDAADIDLLNSLGDRDVDLGHSVLERVQVADDIIDLVDVLLGEVLLVRGEVTGQYASVHGGVESLYTASEHLGGLSDSGNVPVREGMLAGCPLGAQRY